jgi:lysophospholipase L1-like esterase
MNVKPEVFVIGDSISIQYGPYLEAALGDDFRYARKSGEEEALKDLDHPQGANGGDSSMVLDYVKTMMNDEKFQPDLLLLNCGLHDIKSDSETGEKQVPLDQYRENILNIIGLLAQRDIRFAWIRTTPVDDEQHNSRSGGFHRHADDLREYNAAADAIMASVGAPVIDLHGFTETLGENLFCDHVHFNDSVRKSQGEYIAQCIKENFVSNNHSDN